ETFPGAIGRCLLSDLVGDGSQCELAQRIQIALTEEIAKRLLHFFGLVDLSLPQAVAQLLDRDVDVDHLVGTIEKRVGHRLAHADAGDPCNGVVQRLEVLNVHGRHDVDAGVEEFEDVLIPLLVFAAWNVGMRQFVDDDDIRTTCDDPVDVHLLHRHAAVFHLAPRNDLEVLYLRVGIGAPVGFDDADRDVQAAGFQRVRFLQHRVRLADTWRGADVDAQTRAIALLHSREQCLRVYFLIGHCSSSARLSWRTLTRGSPRNPNWRSSMWLSTRARIADSLARRD